MDMDEVKNLFRTFHNCYAETIPESATMAMTEDRFLQVWKLYGLTPTKQPTSEEKRNIL